MGETETGAVYEQAMQVSDQEGSIRTFRRITVVLCVS